jgi:hypothetical protein
MPTQAVRSPPACHRVVKRVRYCNIRQIFSPDHIAEDGRLLLRYPNWLLGGGSCRSSPSTPFDERYGQWLNFDRGGITRARSFAISASQEKSALGAMLTRAYGARAEDMTRL